LFEKIRIKELLALVTSKKRKELADFLTEPIKK
jgi:hypothetical protein